MLQEKTKGGVLHTAFVPYFLGLAPLLESAPLLGSAPPIRLQILTSAPVRVGAPPSDKRPLQISFDFDQKDGEPELFLNQLTSKSLGLFFFIEYLSNTCMLYKKLSVLKNSQ